MKAVILIFTFGAAYVMKRGQVTVWTGLDVLFYLKYITVYAVMNKQISTKVVLSAIVIVVLLSGGIISAIIYSQFDATAKLESSVLAAKEKTKTVKKSSSKKTMSEKNSKKNDLNKTKSAGPVSLSKVKCDGEKYTIPVGPDKNPAFLNITPAVKEKLDLLKAAGFIKETAILYDGKSSKTIMNFDAKFITTPGISDPSYPDNWKDTNTLVKGEPRYLIYFYGSFGDVATITKLSEIGYNNEGLNFIWNSSVNQLVPTNTTIDFTCTLK